MVVNSFIRLFTTMTTVAEWIAKNDPSVLRATEEELKRMTLYIDEVDSLEGCPPILKKLDVYGTKIKSLEGAPKSVGKLDASHCHLASLKGCPETFDELNLSYNDLTSLTGMPKHPQAFTSGKLPNVALNNTDITSLEGISEEVGVLDIELCRNLNSLSGIHKHVKKCATIWLTLSTACVQEALLGLLLIEGLQKVSDPEKPDHPALVILRSAMEKFPDDPRKRVMWAQSELIKELGEEGKRYAKL